MNSEAKLEKDAMHVLKATSRTFYIPITLLKRELRLTVGSAYLCMRAIDEVEDHETLEAAVKEKILLETKQLLLADGDFDDEAYQELLAPFAADLPEVTIRLGDWINVCPAGIVGKVQEYTAEMAGGMAAWVKKDWYIETVEDLDDYTYYVAGLVGVMLSEIWYWYDKTETDKDLAIGFGRGLQAVNILRNQHEDFAERGVRFIPNGWDRNDVFDYARKNLDAGDRYLEDIRTKNITHFCKIPLSLAKRTLKAMEKGKEKMSRQEVEEVVAEVKKEQA